MSRYFQKLLEFYKAVWAQPLNFDALEQEARAIYAGLNPNEQVELAGAAIDQADDETGSSKEILCCLACFHPGSLTAFHKRLVERRLIDPAVIFSGASEEIALELMPLLEDDEHRGQALHALAWIGNEVVQSAFTKWRERPPSWAAALDRPPERFAHEAGWELTQVGTRRNLFSEATFPLVSRNEGKSSNGSIRPGLVRTGVRINGTCPWCGRYLTVMLGFEDIGLFFPSHGARRVDFLACDICVYNVNIFARTNDAGESEWHQVNAKPDDFTPDLTDWAYLPDEPLVLSGLIRHYLEAAVWWLRPKGTFSQVGGLPTWMRRAAYPSCPECGSTMPFVGQLDEDECLEGEGTYYCFHCPQCNVTATTFQRL